jgi:hypothetical protein
MNRLFVVVASIVLLAAPALFACEKCIPQGTTDPVAGGPFSSAICWTTDSGPWTYCWGGDSICQGGNVDNSCPVGGGSCNPELPNCILNPVSIARGTVNKCSTVDVSGACLAEKTTEVSLLH